MNLIFYSYLKQPNHCRNFCEHWHCKCSQLFIRRQSAFAFVLLARSRAWETSIWFFPRWIHSPLWFIAKYTTTASLSLKTTYWFHKKPSFISFWNNQKQHDAQTKPQEALNRKPSKWGTVCKRKLCRVFGTQTAIWSCFLKARRSQAPSISGVWVQNAVPTRDIGSIAGSRKRHETGRGSCDWILGRCLVNVSFRVHTY